MYIRVRTIDFASVSTTMRFDFWIFPTSDSVIFMVFQFSISLSLLNKFAHASSYLIIHPLFDFLSCASCTNLSHAVRIKSFMKQTILSIPYRVERYMAKKNIQVMKISLFIISEASGDRGSFTSWNKN